MGGATGGGTDRTYRSEYSSTSTSSHHHQRDSGTRGSPPSFTDGRLNDSSSSSFSQSFSSKQAQSAPKARTTYRTTTTSTSFTSPKDSSTPHAPHTSTRHTTSTHAYTPPRTTSSAQFKDSLRSEKFTQTSHTSRRVEPDEVPERSKSDEFLSRQRGPKTGSFTRTTSTTTTTTRGRDLGGGGGSPGTWRHSGTGTHPQQPRGGASAYPSGSTPQRPSSFSLHSLGDFTTLETRLKEALDSPTLQVNWLNLRNRDTSLIRTLDVHVVPRVSV